MSPLGPAPCGGSSGSERGGWTAAGSGSPAGGTCGCGATGSCAPATHCMK